MRRSKYTSLKCASRIGLYPTSYCSRSVENGSVMRWRSTSTASPALEGLACRMIISVNWIRIELESKSFISRSCCQFSAACATLKHPQGNQLLNHHTIQFSSGYPYQTILLKTASNFGSHYVFCAGYVEFRHAFWMSTSPAVSLNVGNSGIPDARYSPCKLLLTISRNA